MQFLDERRRHLRHLPKLRPYLKGYGITKMKPTSVPAPKDAKPLQTRSGRALTAASSFIYLSNRPKSRPAPKAANPTTAAKPNASMYPSVHDSAHSLFVSMPRKGNGMNNNRLSKRWFKRAPLVAVVGAALVVLSACSATTSTTSSTPPASTKPLVIGISLSLTGDFADPGLAVKKGYELWADTVNAKGGVLGRQVVLKIVDDLSSPTQVVTNYQNLITRDKVDLVFGPFSSLLTVPASTVANRYKYAFIESAGGGPKVFAQKLGNLFFVQPGPVVKQGDVFADYILALPAAQRPKTAAYPSLDDPFASPIADTIRARFEAAGIKTVYSATYPAETPDL